MSSKIHEKVEESLEEKEQKVISKLISLGIIGKTIHPFTKEVVYLRSEKEVITEDVELFAQEVVRMKPARVKIKLNIGGQNESPK